MFDVLGRLVEWLKAPEQTGLRRAFVVWSRRVMLPHRAPGMELPEFNDLQDHHEGHDMLAERTLSRLNASASSGGMPVV